MVRPTKHEHDEVAELEESLGTVAAEAQELRAEVLRRGTLIRDLIVRMQGFGQKSGATDHGFDESSDQAALAMQLAQQQHSSALQVEDLSTSISTKDALITRLQLELAAVQRHDADYRSEIQRLRSENAELRAALTSAVQTLDKA